MVSTPSSQYITDYSLPSGGKSPLALLAKTCETIGLPESNGKKAAGSKTPDKEKKSPQSKRPCTTPGCPPCNLSNPDFMAAFAANPLFAAYCNPFYPMSSSASFPSPFLFAGLPPTSSFQVPTSTPTSLPANKITCDWQNCGKAFASGDELTAHFKSCHVVFNSPASPASSSSESRSSPTAISKATKAAPLSSSNSNRYHPYSKGGPTTPSLPLPNSSLLPNFPIPFSTAALQAMYQQHRLMSTMPIP